MKYLIRFLRKLADPKNLARTKMSMKNLALVFAPNLLRCPHDDPLMILENSKSESEVMFHVFTNLKL